MSLQPYSVTFKLTVTVSCLAGRETVDRREVGNHDAIETPQQL